MINSLVACAGLLCTLVAAADAHAQAAAPAAKVEQVYLELIVSKGAKVVSQPHLLAKLGADGQVSFSPRDPDGPGPLQFKFHTQASGKRITVRVTALVDEQQVATRTFHITKTAGGKTSFDAGGYTWRVNANYMSEAFLKKKQDTKWPRAAAQRRHQGALNRPG